MSARAWACVCVCVASNQFLCALLQDRLYKGVWVNKDKSKWAL
jgi:hypothetical protein